MQSVKIAVYGACSIFLWQLLSLSPSYSVPVYTYGDIQQQSRKVATQETHVYKHAPARFAAVDDAYDTVLFVGDVLLARNVEFLMQRHGADYPYAGLSFGDLASNPAVVGNFEASVPLRHQPTAPQKLKFSVDASYLPAARAAGFTHFSLANNHSYDFDSAGFLHTKEALLAAALEPVGSPVTESPEALSYIQASGEVVALIALNGLRHLSETDLSALVDHAAQRSDMQVVYIHWGTEYETVSSKSQQALASSLVDAGADLIIGHHPHVVQEIGLIDGVPVVYSLGNYIFDQYFDGSVQTGLVLELNPSRQMVHLIPTNGSGRLSQPTYLSPEDHQLFLRDLASKSDPSLAAYIQNGVIPLHGMVATSTKIAMIEQ